MSDNVNHPPHYKQGSIEVIDVLEDWQLGLHEANAVKYIARARHKGKEEQDLKKAIWYLQRRLLRLAEEQNREHYARFTQPCKGPIEEEICTEPVCASDREDCAPPVALKDGRTATRRRG